MTPYYADDVVTIYHGDCRDILPHLAPSDFGVMLTDPPYGISYRVGSLVPARAGKGQLVANDQDLRVRDDILAWRGDLPALVFGSWKQPPPEGTRETLVWHKNGNTGMGDLTLPWRPSWEEIYVLGQGFTGTRSTAVLDAHLPTIHPDRKTHPTAKPVGLLVALLDKCPPGAVIDPCMGGGLNPACREGRRSSRRRYRARGAVLRSRSATPCPTVALWRGGDGVTSCPSSRCKGSLVVAASGVHADGTAVEFAECDRCGRIVEQTAAIVDHPALFEEETA